MGMFKWLKKEWVANASRRPSRSPSGEDSSQGNSPTIQPIQEVQEDSDDPVRTLEYKRALEQFFARRADISPSKRQSNPSNTLQNNNLQDKIGNKENINIACNTDASGRKQLDVSTVNDLKLTVKSEENSPGTSNSNKSPAKYGNKSVSVLNYDKFQRGNIQSSLNQHCELGKRTSSSETTPEQLIGDSSKVTNLQNMAPSLHRELSNNSPEKLEKPSSLILESQKNGVKPTKESSNESDNVTNSELEDVYEDNFDREMKYLELWGSNTASQSSDNESQEEVKQLILKICKTTSQFNILLTKSKDLKLKNDGGFKFGNFCEWKEGEWNGTSVMIRKVKPYCNIKCEEFLETELKILMVIKHPNILLLMGLACDPIYKIVPIYEYFRYSLFVHMNRMGLALSLQEIVYYIKQICNATLFLHGYNFIHTVISSHTIMLDRFSYNAKLCGFDSAVSLQSLSSSTTKQKNCIRQQFYPWLAPELFINSEQVFSPLCDIYSLCLVFWECSIMKTPWENMTFQQICDIYNEWGTGIQVPEEIFPSVIEKMLVRGLTVDRNNRKLSLEKMIDVLKIAEDQLLTRDDIYIFLLLQKRGNLHSPNSKRRHGKNVEVSPSRPSKDLSNTFSTPKITVSQQSLRHETPEENKNDEGVSNYTHTKTSSHLKDGNSSVRIEHSVTFVRTPQNGTTVEVNCNSAPSQLNYYTSLPNSPKYERKDCVSNQSQDFSTPSTPVAKNSFERKHKWLEGSSKGSDRNFPNYRRNKKTLSPERDPFTGLRRISKQNYHKSDSQLTNSKFTLNTQHLRSISNTLRPIPDFKTIIETHETWIKESKQYSPTNLSPGGSSRSIAVKPASHRIEFMPEQKSPQFKIPASSLPSAKSRSNSIDSLSKMTVGPGGTYSHMPKQIRGAVKMHQVLNENLKTFFESSLWKKEKLKCLPAVNRDVQETSVLKRIIQSESESQNNDSDQVRNNLDTESDKKRLKLMSPSKIASVDKMLNLKTNIQPSDDKKPSSKQTQTSSLIISIGGFESSSDDNQAQPNENVINRNIFISEMIVPPLKVSISETKNVNDPTTDEKESGDPVEESENKPVYNYMNEIVSSILNRVYKEIYENEKQNVSNDITENISNNTQFIYEINKKYLKHRSVCPNNKALGTPQSKEERCPSRIPLNNISKCKKKSSRSSWSAVNFDENKKENSKTSETSNLQISDDFVMRGIESSCSLELLPDSRWLQCSACGSFISTDSERNETQSQPEIRVSECSSTDGKMKRSREVSNLADMESMDDIYLDDDYTAPHLQLSLISTDFNKSFYDLTPMDESLLQQGEDSFDLENEHDE